MYVHVCMYITAFASISSNQNRGSFDSEGPRSMWAEKILFRVESHICVGAEFESK